MEDKFIPKDRVERLMEGREIDRPPVSCWQHFYDQEWSAEKLAKATIDYQNKYNWDFVKINPRSSYYVEGWGAKFKHSGKPDEKPIYEYAPIKSVQDWLAIKPLDIGDAAFGEQLKATDLISRQLDDKIDFFQTVFSPLSIAADMTASDDEFKKLLNAGKNLESALEAITATLEDYVDELLRIGISGIFFATTEWATRDNITEEQYLEFGQPYDLRILRAARPAKFNILHVCRRYNMLPLFKHYPVEILSWNKFEEGNLDFAQADKIFNQVFLGGADHLTSLLNGTPDDVRQQVKESIADAGDHPLLVGPGCALKLGTPEANIKALREAVY
jgi:uroporphyrinogen decarboxylase